MYAVVGLLAISGRINVRGKLPVNTIVILAYGCTGYLVNIVVFRVMVISVRVNVRCTLYIVRCTLYVVQCTIFFESSLGLP